MVYTVGVRKPLKYVEDFYLIPGMLDVCSFLSLHCCYPKHGDPLVINSGALSAARPSSLAIADELAHSANGLLQISVPGVACCRFWALRL